MIPEPQRTYVLELMAALGPAATGFVIAGAQAIKFAVTDARGTKDVDFVLDVIALRAEPLQLHVLLMRLGYVAVPAARNFQFEKPVPNSVETMRIEFMAPEEFKRSTDFRVDVQEGFTPAPAQVAPSPLPSRMTIHSKAACRTESHSPPRCVSPGRTPWLCLNCWLCATATTMSAVPTNRGMIERKPGPTRLT